MLHGEEGEHEIYTEMLSPISMKVFVASLLKLLLVCGPIGHDTIHERMEPWPVIRFEEMAELVNDHVFQAFWRIECKANVEADAPCFGLAAAPKR